MHRGQAEQQLQTMASSREEENLHTDNEQLRKERCLMEENEKLRKRCNKAILKCERLKDERDTAVAHYQSKVAELQADVYRLKQELKAKHEEVRELQASGGHWHSQNQASGSSGQDIRDQRMTLGQMYDTVEGEGTNQHRKVRAKLMSLEKCIDDFVEKADSKANPELPGDVGKSFRPYNRWHLGYRAILCKMLQLCYDTCKQVLVKDVIPEAVESMQHSKVAFSDAVMAMLKDSIPETSNLQATAQRRLGQFFDPTPDLSVSVKEMQQYTAVYQMVAEHIKWSQEDAKRRKQSQKDAKHMEQSQTVAEHIEQSTPSDYHEKVAEKLMKTQEYDQYSTLPHVKDFMKTIAPMCWDLATIHKPPIFVCCLATPTNKSETINGAFHQKHPESTMSTVILAYLFPLVYKDFEGYIEKKAKVLT